MTKSDRIEKYISYKVGNVENYISFNDLIELGFFDVPASTKYHGNYAGGLFDHSLAVTETLVDLTNKLGLEWSRPESPYIVGMYHDLCKCDLYKPVYKRYEIKNNSGNVVKTYSAIESYEYNDKSLLDGHGTKSVIIALKFIPLTDEEIACIRWHMGAYERDPKMWDYYGRAVEKYPNVLYTHTADMIASKTLGV